MDRFTGGCLCGNVRIVATGLPYRIGLCHCLDCRKHHGALFHASAVFPQNAVTITGENTRLRRAVLLPPLRIVCLLTHRRRNRSELRLPGRT